ncbi:hypothetical protein L0F63_007336 [Massospora cicadina]|nr:hypothetical protein L0F63_007336 [Massospora cicadina]
MNSSDEKVQIRERQHAEKNSNKRLLEAKENQRATAEFEQAIAAVSPKRVKTGR